MKAHLQRWAFSFLDIIQALPYHLMVKQFISILIAGVIFSTPVFSAEKFSLLRLPNERMVTGYLPVINQDITQLELGFLVEKAIWRFPFQAFVNGFMMNKKLKFSKTGIITDKSEFNDDPDRKVNAGALGVKAGILIPTNSLMGFSLLANFGWGKMAVHPNPWLGRNDATIEKKELWLYELGWLINFQQYYMIAKRTMSNRRYFTDEYFLGFGMTF